MKNPAAEDHNMFVCCMFLELGLGIVWNLNCHGFLLEPSVFWSSVQVFGIPCTSLFFCVAVVLMLWTFSMGCWSLSFGPYLLKGLNSSTQHVGYGKVFIIERPALSTATVQSLMDSAQLPRLCQTKLG